jgi:hypothetical protein
MPHACFIIIIIIIPHVLLNLISYSYASSLDSESYYDSENDACEYEMNMGLRLGRMVMMMRRMSSRSAHSPPLPPSSPS